MSLADFPAYGKTPRLFREAIITEKIDGTNGLVAVSADPALLPSEVSVYAGSPGGIDLFVAAGSRKRWVTPGSDNFGFAAWAHAHAALLATTLGTGFHYGEWYGAGIQRGYGLPDRRFALFAVDRYAEADLTAVPHLETVPVIWRGRFETGAVEDALFRLQVLGSHAVPGWDRPEGVIVWHDAARQVFKALLENDDLPKGDLTDRQAEVAQ